MIEFTISENLYCPKFSKKILKIKIYMSNVSCSSKNLSIVKRRKINFFFFFNCNRSESYDEDEE